MEFFPSCPGLTLHPGAISAALAGRLEARVAELQVLGRAGTLPNKHTYKPVTGAFVARKQSRELLQFGCYTHANRVEVVADVADLRSEPLLVEVVDCLVAAGVFAGGSARSRGAGAEGTAKPPPRHSNDHLSLRPNTCPPRPSL